ncbi:hypothetical protein BROUX41_001816 [Berkeleyomyces rouxiae]|uniref:uncharacterized protein n=1 Tax=Berkeleyomyces rouxiae TaxID=2035830 RepID=UPI003B7FC51B
MKVPFVLLAGASSVSATFWGNLCAKGFPCRDVLDSAPSETLIPGPTKTMRKMPSQTTSLPDSMYLLDTTSRVKTSQDSDFKANCADLIQLDALLEVSKSGRNSEACGSQKECLDIDQLGEVLGSFECGDSAVSSESKSECNVNVDSAPKYWEKVYGPYWNTEEHRCMIEPRTMPAFEGVFPEIYPKLEEAGCLIDMSQSPDYLKAIQEGDPYADRPHPVDISQCPDAWAWLFKSLNVEDSNPKNA